MSPCATTFLPRIVAIPRRLDGGFLYIWHTSSMVKEIDLIRKGLDEQMFSKSSHCMKGGSDLCLYFFVKFDKVPSKVIYQKWYFPQKREPLTPRIDNSTTITFSPNTTTDSQKWSFTHFCRNTWILRTSLIYRAAEARPSENGEVSIIKKSWVQGCQDLMESRLLQTKLWTFHANRFVREGGT